MEPSPWIRDGRPRPASSAAANASQPQLPDRNFARGQPCRYVGAAADVIIVARPRFPKPGREGKDGRGEPEPDAARLTLRGTDGWIALRGCWDGGDVIHRHRRAPAHTHVLLCRAYAPAGLTSSVWRVPGCPWTLVLAAAAAERLARKDVQVRTAGGSTSGDARSHW